MNVHPATSQEGMSYGRFFAMIATSTLIMYGLTYLNSFDIVGHARRYRRERHR